MRIREATCEDAAAVARVHVDGWHATYPGIVPADFLANLTYEDREQRWRRQLCEDADARFVYVAEDDDGQIVGFAWGGPERTGDPVYLGEIYAIYLLETHQRQRIGRRLVFRVTEQLEKYGMKSMLVWVLAENQPARGFYEMLEGKLVRTRPITIGGTTLEEVAYGWEDTRTLKRLARAKPA